MNKANEKPLLTKSQRRFRNKYGSWAVVTGASSGIGRAISVMRGMTAHQNQSVS